MCLIEYPNSSAYKISSEETIFNQENYWEIMSITSIANGLMESVLERRMEMVRSSNEQSKNSKQG